jgi:probable rRNA maturation factor
MSEFDPERRAFNLGEIVVSFQTARREAAARGLPVTEELGRYCVHGFLHLLGYEDDKKSAREALFRIQEGAIGRDRARRKAACAKIAGLAVIKNI